MVRFPTLNAAQRATLLVAGVFVGINIVSSGLHSADMSLPGGFLPTLNLFLWLALGFYVAAQQLARWWTRTLGGIALWVASIASLIIFFFSLPHLFDFSMIGLLTNDYAFAVKAGLGEAVNMPLVLLPVFIVQAVFLALPYGVFASWPHRPSENFVAT